MLNLTFEGKRAHFDRCAARINAEARHDAQEAQGRQGRPIDEDYLYALEDAVSLRSLARNNLLYWADGARMQAI